MYPKDLAPASDALMAALAIAGTYGMSWEKSLTRAADILSGTRGVPSIEDAAKVQGILKRARADYAKEPGALAERFRTAIDEALGAVNALIALMNH